MSELSRRGFLAGLLSSAAVIAAGPVAKIEPYPVSNQLLPWLTEHQEFMEGLSQQITTTLWYGNAEVSPTQFRGLAPFYNSSLDGALRLADGFNVIDGGDSPPYVEHVEPDMVVGTFPRNSRAGMTFRRVA